MKAVIWGPTQENIVAPFRKRISGGEPLPDECMRYYFALVSGGPEPLAVLRMHDKLSDNEGAEKNAAPSKVVELEFRELLLSPEVSAETALLNSADMISVLVRDTYPLGLPVHMKFKIIVDLDICKKLQAKLNALTATTGRRFNITEPAISTV